MTGWISSLAGVLLGVASVTSAFAADLGPAAPAYRVVPGKAASGACADPSVLSTIVTRFDYTAANALRSVLPDVDGSLFYLSGYYSESDGGEGWLQ